MRHFVMPSIYWLRRTAIVRTKFDDFRTYDFKDTKFGNYLVFELLNELNMRAILKSSIDLQTL